jgi:hypothetical protein
MARHDYIPTPDSKFLTWIKDLLLYVQGFLPNWEIPQEVFDPLQVLCNDFEAAFDIAENPLTRTRVSIKNKNDARKALEKAIRAFIREFIIYSRYVTDGDRLAMDLPVHKTTHSKHPEIKSYPVCKIVLLLREIVIQFGDSEKSESTAKPDFVHGAEIRWGILDAKPTSVTELIHSEFDTRTPFNLVFDESERGKIVYFCLRWEGTVGDKGPWGEIMSTIIP